MKNNTIQDVINAIAGDVQVLIEALMDNDSIGNNRLPVKELRDNYRKEDIVVKVASRSGSNAVVIDVLYDSLLEWDRKPRTGKWPSMSDIREWALSKNLPADNRTLNLIRRSIWWNGHTGQSIEEALDRELDKYIDERWGDMIMDAVAAELEKVFE